MYSSMGYCYALCNKLFMLKNRNYNNLVEAEKVFSKNISFFKNENLRLYYYRYKYLGLFVDATPFDLLWQLSQQNILSLKDKNILNKYTPIEDYSLYTGKTVIILGWLATHRSAITDKDKLMGFATFFDGNSFIESVLFPPAYEEYYSFLKYFSLFLIKLDVQIVNASLSLSVVELKPFIPDIFRKIKEAQNGKYNQTAERNTLIHQ
jgi:DNA polymerase III alpha subunit